MATPRTTRRRFRRLDGVDLYRDLGPGDPGYRLRPGASSLDPMETYMEMGRVIGLILSSFLGRGPHEWLVPSAFLMLAGLTFVVWRLLPYLQPFVRIEPVILVAAPIVACGAVILVAVARNVFRTPTSLRSD